MTISGGKQPTKWQHDEDNGVAWKLNGDYARILDTQMHPPKDYVVDRTNGMLFIEVNGRTVLSIPKHLVPAFAEAVRAVTGETAS